MHLSLACWSFPSLALSELAGVARAMGIGSIDVGLDGRSALSREVILADPAGAAAELRTTVPDLAFANYYHRFGDGLAGRNLALPGTVADNVRDLRQVMTFADAAGIDTVFVLPGIVNPGQGREDAAHEGITSLKALGEAAAPFTARLCFEPHVQSWCESPELAARAAEESGVGLALDHAHFACLGWRQDEIDPLCVHAVHVHLRQARPGALQAKFAQGTLNFPALFGALKGAGYTGALTLEVVHQDYMNTLGDDVMTETIALRDAYRAWSATKENG